MTSKLNLSTLYRKEYLYNVDPTDTSLTPFQVLFKALSMRDLDYLRNFKDASQHQLNVAILQKSLIKFYNVFDSTGLEISEPNIALLTLPQITKLANEIYTVSTVTEEIYKKIKLNVQLSMDKKFSTDTWNCEVCRHKGLDEQRNCKFIENYEHIDGFNVVVGEESYDHCPMYYKDNKFVSDIFSCYNALEKGVLPEAGGTVDQTEFFSYATNAVRIVENEKQEKNKE